ncbi:hypothetical protein AV274_6529 [Blastocystis sp. ATCC 50177/Nand II]|uniref:Uncharacterized protein n=1 Tax=Blastocystis sp. subtype 1 (strain ATCC 50177 / NandII) TaxID=478820 RepID=A0A196S3V2_BLAHN|nr:hypothetical protein AV274_6529 [Blastocystis sp. ATCC 50177/Nand II]
MKEGYRVDNANIDVFSKDWDWREELTNMSIQISSLLRSIEEFRVKSSDGLNQLERRMDVVDGKIQFLQEMLK